MTSDDLAATAAAGHPEPEPDVAALRQQLLQLQALHQRGAIEDGDYAKGRTLLERRLVDRVLAGDVAAAAQAPAAAAATGAPLAAARRPVSLRWLVPLAATLVVIAGAGLWWSAARSPERDTVAGAAHPAVAPAASGAGDNASHALSFEQIATMADKLAERLKAQPADAEGWAMLARSYATLGRHVDAVPAYAKAVALRPDDAQLLADYADALAVKNERRLVGEPLELVKRALAIDPVNLKALSLAGTAAFDRQDYAAAVTYWERMVKAAPPGAAMLPQVQASLAEARERAASTPAGAAVPAPAALRPPAASAPRQR